jgi:hypothetical protein
LCWTGDHAEEANLQKLHDYAVQLAHSMSDWYIRHRRWKKLWSRSLRFISGLLVIVAAIVSLLKIFNPELEIKILTGLIGIGIPDPAGFTAEAALVLIGAAGGINLIDRLAGLSTGWMRYMTTVMLIHKELIKFHFEWNRLDRKAALARSSGANAAPGADPAQPPDGGPEPREATAEPDSFKVRTVSIKLAINGQPKEIEWIEAPSDLTLQGVDLVQDFCSKLYSIMDDETAVWADELKNNVTKFTQDVISHHGRDAGRS